MSHDPLELLSLSEQYDFASELLLAETVVVYVTLPFFVHWQLYVFLQDSNEVTTIKILATIITFFILN